MGAYWIGRGAGCKGRRQMSDNGLTETPRIGVVIPLNVHGRVSALQPFLSRYDASIR